MTKFANFVQGMTMIETVETALDLSRRPQRPEVHTILLILLHLGDRRPVATCTITQVPPSPKTINLTCHKTTWAMLLLRPQDLLRRLTKALQDILLLHLPDLPVPQDPLGLLKLARTMVATIRQTK